MHRYVFLTHDVFAMIPSTANAPFPPLSTLCYRYVGQPHGYAAGRGRHDGPRSGESRPILRGTSRSHGRRLDEARWRFSRRRRLVGTEQETRISNPLTQLPGNAHPHHTQIYIHTLTHTHTHTHTLTRYGPPAVVPSSSRAWGSRWRPWKYFTRIGWHGAFWGWATS